MKSPLPLREKEIDLYIVRSSPWWKNSIKAIQKKIRTDLKLQCRSQRKGLKYFTGKILKRNKGNSRLNSKYMLDFINIFYCCSFASDDDKK